MTRKILALAAVAVLGSLPAVAQTYDARTHRTYWPRGLEQQERAITRELNNQQADQPGLYYGPPQYSYVPPQPYSYSPPPRYSYPQPYYAYPYDYPPQPWASRYF